MKKINLKKIFISAIAVSTISVGAGFAYQNYAKADTSDTANLEYYDGTSSESSNNTDESGVTTTMANGVITATSSFSGQFHFGTILDISDSSEDNAYTLTVSALSNTGDVLAQQSLTDVSANHVYFDCGFYTQSDLSGQTNPEPIFKSSDLGWLGFSTSDKNNSSNQGSMVIPSDTTKIQISATPDK